MRHRKKTIKLGRTSSHRESLLANLVCSLIISKRIKTTLPKAKEVIPYVEKLVTKAKKGGLHQRRQIASKTTTVEAVDKLIEVVAPAAKDRNGGTLRLEKTRVRRGDNAQMARVSFVDDLSETTAKSVPKAKETAKKTDDKPKAAAKKTEDKKEDK